MVTLASIYHFTQPLLEWKFLPSWIFMALALACFISLGYNFRGMSWWWAVSMFACWWLMIFWAVLVSPGEIQ